MKTHIKTISKVIFLFSLFFFGSCSEKFIELPPLVKQSEEAFNPSAAVVACYNALNPFDDRWNVWRHYHLGEMITDNCYKGGSSVTDQNDILQIAQCSALPDNPVVKDYWKLCYQQIYRQNWTLKGLKNIKTITQAEKDQYSAEVKFLRAYSYFLLVRAFENVPLILEPLPVNEMKMDKSESNIIWAQIETDLKEAIPLLKGKSQMTMSKDFGRITKGAAQTLLVKAYLYQKKYAECELLAGEVIADGEYSLAPDYKDVWGLESEHSDPGAIFDIVYSPTDLKRHSAIWTASQRSRNWKGWGLNCPSKNLLEEFEQEPGDPRIIWTFQFDGDISEGITVVNSGYDNPDMMHARKAWNALSEDPVNGQQGKNYRVLRYADVLLMYAEAANEMGHTEEALRKLNMVRKRARESSTADPAREYVNYKLPVLPNEQRVPDVISTDKVTLRNAIWHEGRLEFATEGNRFYELVRQGRAGVVMRAYEANGGKQNYGKGFDDKKHVRWPIPQVDIDLSLGVLTQNYGY